jgi:molecular chaperone DnaK (HSP70)
VTNPLNTFYSVKRLIGQQHADVEHLQHVYGTSRAADGSVVLSCPARDCHLAPQEVSAELLKHLLAMATRETGDQSVT